MILRTTHSSPSHVPGLLPCSHRTKAAGSAGVVTHDISTGPVPVTTR